MNSARTNVPVPSCSATDTEGTPDRAVGFLRELIRLAGLELTVHLDTAAASGRSGICVQFEGPDMPQLEAADGKLLGAMEHLLAEVLRIPAGERRTLSLGRGDVGEARQQWIEGLACSALARVRDTGVAYEFPPMDSHERQLLELALQPSGLLTKATAKGRNRHVVLHPMMAPGRILGGGRVSQRYAQG